MKNKFLPIISAILLIFTISCSSKEEGKSTPQQARPASEMAKPADKPNISSTAADPNAQSPMKSQSEKSPEEKIREADESIADSFRQHGESAVVKAGDKLNENERKHSKYAINEPDMTKPPRPIEFKSLKKVYTYFRLKEHLPEPVVEALHGSMVTIVGAVMPFEKIPENGIFDSFWLANPSIVMAGCVFCNPPTLGDLIYIYKDAGEKPFRFEREKLFKQVLLVQVTGRLFFGPDTIKDQTFLQSILVTDVQILN